MKRGGAPGAGDGSPWLGEMSRLNNELTNARRELVKSNAELRRLGAIKDRFLEITAHDLRSPLAAALAGIELLQDPALGESRRLEYLRHMGDTLEFMLSLVEDLLDTASIESGALRLRLESLELSALLRETLRSFEAQAERRGVILAHEEPEGPCAVLADPVRLRQAVGNILSNAIKFSPPGGLVSIELGREGKNLALRVRDRGPGMGAAELETLFAPYSARVARTESGEKNTGLGLFIAKSIAAAHGGELGVESEVGRGTVLELLLPAQGLV
jgi:signal transduction histidine kinase